MSQLARTCGISKANIYHYYESKHALLFDLLDNYLSALRDRLCAVPLNDDTPEVALRAIILETLLAYQGADDEHRVQSSGLSALPADQQRTLRAYQRDMVQHMSAILSRCAPATFANDPSKLRATTMSIFGMLNWFYMWNPGADEGSRRDYAALVSDFALGGIKVL